MRERARENNLKEEQALPTFSLKKHMSRVRGRWALGMFLFLSRLRTQVLLMMQASHLTEGGHCF